MEYCTLSFMWIPTVNVIKGLIRFGLKILKSIEPTLTSSITKKWPKIHINGQVYIWFKTSGGGVVRIEYKLSHNSETIELRSGPGQAVYAASYVSASRAVGLQS